MIGAPAYAGFDAQGMAPGTELLPPMGAPGERDVPTIATTEALADDLRAAEGQAGAEERPAPKPLVLMVEPINGEDADRRRRAIATLYGDGFPLLHSTPERPPEDSEWAAWAEERETSGTGMVRPARHRAARNRLMRHGVQWISSRREGIWEVPPKASTKVRATINMIGPALDWRLQVQTEQRPGVKVVPMSSQPDDRGRATASQRLLDFQYRQQRFAMVRREAAYWAQTDGVSFLHVYWDPQAGPLMRDPASGRLMRAGDVATDVVTLDHVVVSPNATVTRKPFWWVVTEELPTAEAVNTYGDDVVDEGSAGASLQRGIQDSGPRNGARSRAGSTMTEAERERLRDQPTVTKRTVYCEPSEYLPNGLTLVTIGTKVVFIYGLLCGRVPVVPYRDGTSDPAFFPRPKMEQWLEDQMLLNGTYSKLLTNIHRNAGGRYAFRHGTVRPDTLQSGQDVNIEVRGTGDIRELMMPVQGFSIGQEAIGVIEATIKRLEDQTGFNEVARGGTTQESGRAILAVREQLERTFAPSVYAECDGVKGWGLCTMAFCAAFYEVPRAIKTLGQGRPDLGRLITKDDLDGTADVDLEPESMMPLPSSERTRVLRERLELGLITPAQFRRLDRFGFLDDLETPDELHAARAYRYIDALRQDVTTADLVEPIMWQDDEAIWQDLLEREMILAADVPPEQRAAALARWEALAFQALDKQGAGGIIPSPLDPMNPERGAMAPAPMMPGAPAVGAPADPSAAAAPAPASPSSGGESPDPATAASAPTAAMPPAQDSTQNQAARRFEATALQ